MEMLFQHTLAFGYALPCLSQNFGTFAGTNDRMRLPLDGPHSRSSHKRAILMWSACILFCIVLCDAGPNVIQELRVPRFRAREHRLQHPLQRLDPSTTSFVL